MPRYDDSLGWVRVEGLVTPEDAVRIVVACDRGQQLHADDAPLLRPDLPANGATAIVALVPFTKENGATRVVPGSHRRVDQQRVSQKVDHLPGEEYLLGKAGTAFVFSRHLLHAGSVNRSTDPRPALQISYRGSDRSPTVLVNEY